IAAPALHILARLLGRRLRQIGQLCKTTEDALDDLAPGDLGSVGLALGGGAPQLEAIGLACDSWLALGRRSLGRLARTIAGVAVCPLLAAAAAGAPAGTARGAAGAGAAQRHRAACGALVVADRQQPFLLQILAIVVAAVGAERLAIVRLAIAITAALDQL